MRLNSIRLRMLAVIVAVALIASLVLGGSLIYIAHESKKGEVEASALHDSRLIADHVGMYVEKTRDATGIIATDPNTGSALRSGEIESIKPIADGLQTALSQSDIVQ